MAISMSDVASRYHDLLTPELAEESWSHLEHALRRRGLVFGDRLLCTVLRPRFMFSADYHRLRRQIVALMGAFAKAYERAMSDAAFRSQFALEDWEESLLTSLPPVAIPSPTYLLAFFFVPH